MRTKKIIGIKVYMEGSGPSEPETAEKHLRDAVLRGVKVGAFFGDGAFDTNDLMHLIGARPVIKVRKNASSAGDRRQAIRDY